MVLRESAVLSIFLYRNWRAVHHVQTGPAVAAWVHAWVLILIEDTKSTVVPPVFLSFLRRSVCNFSGQHDWSNQIRRVMRQPPFYAIFLHQGWVFMGGVRAH